MEKLSGNNEFFKMWIMSKVQNKENKDKALYMGSVGGGYLIRFHEVDSEGDMFLPNSINLNNFNQMKIRGKIKDFEVDESGVKVIKDFRVESASI